MPLATLTVRPGQSLEFMHLGASLQEICTALKAQPTVFRKLDLAYSADDPISSPIIITLPKNGIRLRFDGVDQRLRLIEILDFHLTDFTYKNDHLVPHLESNLQSPNRAKGSLLYRRIYQLFGPSYPGEFLPSTDKSGLGTYVLSYPGIAFTFPLQTSAWSPKVDHATMLSTSASPVTSLAIYEGTSWPEARRDLFVRRPSNPRCSSLLTARKEGSVDEIESVRVHGAGKVELLRRSGPAWSILLSQTTPQDLITELGPPDQIFKRPAYEGTPPQHPSDAGARVRGRRMSTIPNSYSSSSRSTPSSLSSNNTDFPAQSFSADDDEDSDNPTIHGGEAEASFQESYYCYFIHGFDILVGHPTPISALPGKAAESTLVADKMTYPAPESLKVATRIVLHGNVPGSYPFNSHRRSRWTLTTPPYPTTSGEAEITSESRFPDFHNSLIKLFEGVWPEKDMAEGMVIVRNWNGRDYEAESESPSNSAIWIGGKMDEDLPSSSSTTSFSPRKTGNTNTGFGNAGDDIDDDDDWDAVEDVGDDQRVKRAAGRGKREDAWLKNTKLFKFPGLMFEVMESGAISALTVY